MLLLVLVPVALLVIFTAFALTFFLGVLGYVCWHHLLHVLRDPVSERYEDICAVWSAKARRRRLLTRLHHLKSQQFHSYYHGSKPGSSELHQGLSIVCDWWRQQPSGMPAACMVYLRLTCKTLADTESLAARQLTIRAPLVTPNITSKTASPARRWKAVQAVSYMHRPEQLQALMCFAAAWPNLRQLQVSKPKYMSWKLWHRTVSGSNSSSSDSSNGSGASFPGMLHLGREGDDMLAQLQAAVADARAAAVTVPTAELAAATGSSSSGSGDDGSSKSSSGNGVYSRNHSSSTNSSSMSSSSHYNTAAAANHEGAALHLVAGLVLSASHWPYLQTLSLSHLGLTPAAAQLLAHAARWWPLLRNCNMSCNSLGESGILVLLEAAVNNWHQLQVLNFGGDTGVKGFTAAAAAAAGAGGVCPDVEQQQHVQLLRQLLQPCADATDGGSVSHFCSSSSSSSSPGGSTSCTTNSSSSSSCSRRWMIVRGKSSSNPAGLHGVVSDLLSCTECSLAQASGGSVPSCRSQSVTANRGSGSSMHSAGVCARWHQVSACSSSSSSTGSRPVTEMLCSNCTAPQQLPLLLLL